MSATIADVLEGRARWCVVEGDCLDVLPTIERVDHVITDPPYEAEAHTLSRRACVGRDGRKGYAEYAIDFAQMDDATRAASAREMSRASGGWALVFCQVEGVLPWRRAFEEHGAHWRRAAAWIKPDGSPQFSGDRPAMAYETIACWWCGDPPSRWNAGGKRGVYTHCIGHTPGAPKDHPTTKPLALMQELIEDFTNPDDVILDPFCGSGSTGCAALRLGRRFIGIERDATYAKLATDRLRAEEQGSDLRSARAGQLPLLAGGER